MLQCIQLYVTQAIRNKYSIISRVSTASIFFCPQKPTFCFYLCILCPTTCFDSHKSLHYMLTINNKKCSNKGIHILTSLSTNKIDKHKFTVVLLSLMSEMFRMSTSSISALLTMVCSRMAHS